MKIPAFTKTYGGRRVLNMPRFELKCGKVYAVVGSNGSGKTTLARVLAGVETPDLGGAVLSDADIGYMPQKSYAFRMSVRANVLLGGGDAAKADELMRALMIDGLADKPAHKLSGGETARMALARLMMRERELMILDEPTASMDMESTALSEQLIRERCKSTDCTILLVTHSLQQARRISDEVIFFHKGELVEYGESKKVLYFPEKDKTRDFLAFYSL